MWLMAEVSLLKLPSDKRHYILLIISQHWLRQWSVAVRQRPTHGSNIYPDICCHMAPRPQLVLFHYFHFLHNYITWGCSQLGVASSSTHQRTCNPTEEWIIPSIDTTAIQMIWTNRRITRVDKWLTIQVKIRQHINSNKFAKKSQHNSILGLASRHYRIT